MAATATMATATMVATATIGGGNDDNGSNGDGSDGKWRRQWQQMAATATMANNGDNYLSPD